MRTCTACGVPKPLNAFYNHSRDAAKPKLYGECKQCICAKHTAKLRQTCTVCGKEKPLREFYKRTAKRGEAHLYQRQCKRCVGKKHHVLYVAKLDHHRAQNKEYGAQRRALIKDAVFKHYGGYQCACCGETEKTFLTLDHIHDDGADFRRKLVGSQARGGGYVTYRYLYKHGFPGGFQILCANCQHGKRMNKGICPHQVRCNDQEKSVEPSGSKRSAPLFALAG